MVGYDTISDIDYRLRASFVLLGKAFPLIHELMKMLKARQR